ncbi:hypothetical protein ANN_10963, partial [Periplaneta americana]
LPQIEDSLLSVTDLIVSGRIKDKVNNGLEEFDKIQQEIQNAVKDLIPKISKNMQRAGDAIENQSRKMNKILRNVNAAVMNHSFRAVDMGEKLITEYGYYRYYAGLSVSSVMLLILLCATLGLFYGFCGKRPDGYGDDCCSRATGARFLILKVQDNRQGLELNVLHQLLVYADDVNMLGENTQTIRENAEILLEASKAIGLEVNPEKIKYMIMSRDQNIVRNGNIKIGDLSFEEVEKFKYLGATVTNINDTREEIKRRINMGNACCYSVEKLLSSSLLSKNLKVRIYKTVILPVVLYGCETWTLTLREEHRLRVFENKVLRKIFGAKWDEVTGEWRKLHNTELHALGVWVIFLFSAVLMMITLVHFLLGIIAERAICEPLQNPNNNQLLTLIDKMVRLDKFFQSDVEINVSSIIRSCHANGSIYEVLHVANLVNISEVSDYKSRYGIDNVINQLKTRIDFGGNVTILTEDAKFELQRLAHSNITRINFTMFAEVLNKSIVNIDLETLAGQLRNTAKEITSASYDIKKTLMKQADILDALQFEVVRHMEAQVRTLDKKTKALEETLKFNHSSLNESINLILLEVTNAQDYLNNTASKEIKNLADMFANAILGHVDQYLNRVVNMTTTMVGQCQPMSQVYNATVVAVCNQILDPFNGFWASIGWCLVLFIPAIILSVKLAALYQKSDPYPGPLVES